MYLREHSLDISHAINEWQLLGGVELPQHPTQKMLMKPIHERVWSTLIDSSDRIGRARLLGCRCRGSGDWLTCIPSAPFGLLMTDQQFQVACSLRAGAPITAPYQCKCGSIAGTDGSHSLVCPQIKSRLTRHGSCNQVIAEGLRRAGLQSSLEPVGLMRNDGRRPDGITITSWERGRPICWDFTCVNRLASSHVRSGTQDGPSVANEAEQRKEDHYRGLPETVTFTPVAVETLGGIGSKSFTFLSELGKRIRRQTGEESSFLFLRQRLGLEVQRGNAECVLESIGNFKL